MTSNTQFFREREAPAVLKHGILSRYPTVFASAAGQRAERVVLLDGYAGRGQYEDGTAGSPVLLLETAANTQGFRRVHCVFVEMDTRNFDELQRVVDSRAETNTGCTALKGDLSDHLEPILRDAAGSALFAFLDPFGAALAYEELTERILSRPKHPPTEVLLHVSVNAIRRIGGLLRTLGEDPACWSSADAKTISRLDRFLGGDWWHAIVHEVTDVPKSATEIAEAVVDQYCKRVRDDSGYGSLLFPVRNRPELSPEYFLVLFSRNSYAFWRFNDVLSKAHVDWQDAWREKENRRKAARAEATAARAAARDQEMGVMSLFGDELPPAPSKAIEVLTPFDETGEASRWVTTIESNLISLLETGSRFRLIDSISAVYGNVLGEAREMHVRRALKNLYSRGESPDDGRGNDFFKRWIGPKT